MEHQNIINTLNNGERVTSTYAEIYFNDVYCESKNQDHVKHALPTEEEENKDEWVSPSDLLIGILELKPPFTSKITRGKTHEGILAIGNAVLERERAKFLNSLTTLLQDNDASWNYILINEKEEVIRKVKAIFLNIYEHKSDIMKKEISIFYENSLRDLEEHLRSELQTVLKTTRANIISKLNDETRQNLRKERKILVDALAKKYCIEVQKIRKYYKLLLDNELNRNNTLINKALHERNDAVRAFYKQSESARLTSTMYIMSLERKKCQIKKMILENLQTTEITEKLKTIKDRENVIEALKEKEVRITDINKQWEEKIRKILQLFLKFISFSLKLLPEQTTFLLDLEKMVVLQLNEMQKNPKMKSTVLIEEKDPLNVFEFPKSEEEVSTCEKEPFVIVGDLSEPVPPRYGSRETLPSDVELPFFRLGRQYVYAKCHGYENIKKFLASQVCRCNLPSSQISPSSPVLERKVSEHTTQAEPKLEEIESSTEAFVVDEGLRLEECPVRKCYDWLKRNAFPYLASYIEYNEENYKRVTAILDRTPRKKPAPKLISPKFIANKEPPYSATKDLRRTVETQYSSQEDLTVPEVICPCIGNTLVPFNDSHYILKSSSSQALNEALLKRKLSLQRLIDKNPKLLQIFSDECYDYKL